MNKIELEAKKALFITAMVIDRTGYELNIVHDKRARRTYKKAYHAWVNAINDILEVQGKPRIAL